MDTCFILYWGELCIDFAKILILCNISTFAESSKDLIQYRQVKTSQGFFLFHFYLHHNTRQSVSRVFSTVVI